MRVYLVLLGALALAWRWGGEPAAAADSKPPAGLLARIHFAGSAQLLADTDNAARLNEIAALPATAPVRDAILQKLATAPFRFLQTRLPPQAGDHSDLTRPLVDDLLHNESCTELWGPTDGVPGLVLAVRVGPERAKLWRTSLATVIGAWTGMQLTDFQADGYPGWELKKHHNPNLIRFVEAGGWAVFGWGQDKITGQAEMVRRIKTDGRPTDALKDSWLEAWADLPTLATLQTNTLPFPLPQMQLTVGTKTDFIRTKALLQFHDPLQLALSPWNVPTNLVRNPLINFTAVRGVAGWLQQFELVKAMQLQPVPDQLYHWGMTKAVFESFLAVPVPNATNAVEKFAPRVISLVNSHLEGPTAGRLRWNSTNATIEWVGLPMVFPHLRGTSGTNGSFLEAGLFPSIASLQPAPQELFSQIIGRTNLVYYDWEVTGEHLNYWRNLMIIHAIAGKVYYGTANVPFQAWLDGIAAKLVPTVTEVTQTSANELTLLRKSPIGFTALELTALERWIGAPGFPMSAEYKPASSFPWKKPVPPAGGKK